MIDKPGIVHGLQVDPENGVSVRSHPSNYGLGIRVLSGDHLQALIWKATAIVRGHVEVDSKNLQVWSVGRRAYVL